MRATLALNGLIIRKVFQNGKDHRPKVMKASLLDSMFLLCYVHVSQGIHTLEFPECQGTPCSKQLRYLKFKWLQRDLNPQPLSSLLSMTTWFQLNCNFSALLLVSSRHFYRSIKVTSQYLHWWWSFKTSLKSSLSNSKTKLPSRMLLCDWIEKD